MATIPRVAIAEFIRNHRLSGRVLDLGCGSGPYAGLLKDSRRIGYDVAAQSSVDVQGDSLHLPFGGATFDSILCTEMLEHVVNPFIAVSEMKRVLREDGVLLLTTRFCYPIHCAPHDYFRFTEFGLRSLFKDWKIEHLSADSNAIGAIATMTQYVIQRLSARFGRRAPGYVGKVFEALTVPVRWFSRAHKESGAVTAGYLMIARNRTAGKSEPTPLGAVRNGRHANERGVGETNSRRAPR